MGRTSYTPQTVSYLQQAPHAHARGVRVAVVPAEEDEHKPTPEQLQELSSVSAPRADSTSGGRFRIPPAALPQHPSLPTWHPSSSFDPDDESLPVFTEKFIDPSAAPTQDELQEQQGIDQAVHSSQEPFSRLSLRMAAERRERLRVLYAQRDGRPRTQTEEDLLEEDEEEDLASMQEYEPERGQQTMSTEPSLPENTTEEDEEEEEGDEDELPHGNQGYYDFPTNYNRHSTRHLLAAHHNNEAANANSGANTGHMSPSAPVFHSHTLPFSLPPPAEFHRRVSAERVSAGVSMA